ncbi:hypothetical protein CRUP_029932 [Coryphaenoides rupestris]|nr:hypothetical protein CRUP_029932 [Coryphaenoides rupestris]
MPMPRTFAGHYVSVTDESITDYLDTMSQDTGSGQQQQVEKPNQHRSQKPAQKTYYRVSPEAKHFLQGRLSTVLVPTVYTFVFIISVPLNLAAAVMFLRRAGPRKPAVIYMLNLAAADLLFALVLPLKIAYHYQGNDWPHGSFLCRLVTAAFYCNMYCSVLLMTCISVDRFLAVVHPMDALAWRTPRTAHAACAAMWLLALAGVGPLLLLPGQTVPLPDLGITTCHDVQDVGRLRAYYLYFFPVYAALFFFVPLVLTTVCYACIVRALVAANAVHRSRNTRRAVIMTVTVLVVFVGCFAPANLLMMVHYAQVAHDGGGAAADASYRAYLLSTCTGTLSCCLDPLVYYFGSSQCQRQAVAMLTRKGPAGAKAGSSRSSGSGNSSKRTQSVTCTQMESVQEGQYRKLIS